MHAWCMPVASLENVTVGVSVTVGVAVRVAVGVTVRVGVNVAPVESDNDGGNPTGTDAPELSSKTGDTNVSAYSPGDRTTTSRRKSETVPEIVAPDTRSNDTARLPGAPVQAPVTEAPVTAHAVTSITTGS